MSNQAFINGMDSNTSNTRKMETLHELARTKHERRQRRAGRHLARAAGIAGAGAITATAATETAAADPQGVLEATSSGDSLLKIRADRIVLVPRTTDVSSPADGTLTYRSDL